MTFGSDGKTPILEFGEKTLYMLAKPARGGKWEPRFHPGVFVRMLNSSSEAVAGCRRLRTGQGRQQAHNEACRWRIEGLLKGDPAGSARLAAADERINRALADAVERHATNDPGVRGILKRASVVRHPESESQKKISLDTEQDPTPHLHVSYGGSSASGARPSATTSTDEGTGTSRKK